MLPQLPRGSGGFTVIWDTADVRKNIGDLTKVAMKRIGIVADRTATDAQSYMRSNAPWHDITGNARNGLFGEVENNKESVVIHLYHTVSYGVFLETMQSGRFAIIGPTIDIYSDQFMRDLKDIFS